MNDGFEIFYGFDPLNKTDGTFDNDSDLLLNNEESIFNRLNDKFHILFRGH